jgi:excinuclease ABC subunit B
MPPFRLVAPYQPTGDQPRAIERLADGLARGMKHQTLLGATGTGKTFTIASLIERQQKPTLVLAHNKTLAAQLYAEFREFFPDNAVEYFVSYFDYYQPEAYLPRSDTYIEKDSSRNDEIDKLRHAATKALFERRDVIIVASVSCIYGLGAPVDYGATVIRLRVGGQYRRDGVLRQLVDLQYQRNDAALTRARFRVRGDTLELQPAYDDFVVRIQFFGDEVERIVEIDPLTGEVLAERKEVAIYPASHYVTPADKLKAAMVDIEAEMEERCAQMEAEGRVLEAARLRQRTTFDLEMMRELGFCSGIENYSRHLARRPAGSRPWTLLDYFPPDWLLVVDESHMTIPQVVGMYKNDRTRKEILVDFGFRLPSALDNRPLTFEEFDAHLNQAIYMSATPAAYELGRSEQVVEQLIRPTGIVDPPVRVQATRGQIDDLLDRIHDRVARGERVLVTTLTKKMAEELAAYLKDLGVKVAYLHSEVDTLERVQILRDLRLGVYDVLVGINLLREGIDLPEVTLVAILDADKEGFLRSAWSLIQVSGRAARNVGGEVVMYADVMTDSMKLAISEMERRRAIQLAYNAEHGIQPTTIVKEVHDLNDRLRAVAEAPGAYVEAAGGRELSEMSREQVEQLVARMEAEMRAAARELEFEKAAALRDEIQQVRLRVLEEDASVQVGRAAERAATAARGAPAFGARGARRAPAPAVRSGGQAGGRGTGGRARQGGGRGRVTDADAGGVRVSSVEVLPAADEPGVAVAGPGLDPVRAVGGSGGAADGHATDGHAGGGQATDEGTASDWLPGIRDEHDDEDAGWQAKWLERPTWDSRVTPNVIRRTGQRPRRR